MRNIPSALLAFLIFVPGNVQAATQKPTFEVAAIRPSAPNTRNILQGGPGTPDTAQIAWTSCPLDFLIERAYGIEPDQFSGPAWLSSAMYDITAKVPAGTAPEQFDEMLRNLLEERFHLQVHHETRVLPAYDLVLRRGSHKLKPSEWVPLAVPDPVPGEHFLGNAPIFRTGRDGNSLITGRGAKTSELVKMLRVALHRRVQDKTGLTGKYDFTVEYSDRAGGTAPYIIDAVREQLGLDLTATKISVDGVVVDQMDKTPTEN